MDHQLQNHQATVSRIAAMLGTNNSTHLNKCLYSVYVGSNNWMFDYFFPGSPSPLQFTPRAFANTLISQLSRQLTTLYDRGARKVVLFGIGPLGCLPILSVNGQCNSYINQVLEMYNSKLRSLVLSLNNKFSDAMFTWINTIRIVTPDLSGLGLKVRNIPCCGALEVACRPISVPCSNRNEYAYWDNAHPTEAANRVLADRAYTARDQDDAFPIDISHLVNTEHSDAPM